MTYLEQLLGSDEPSVRWRTRRLAGERPSAAEQEAIRSCERVRQLLSARAADGRLEPVTNAYRKWYGAHWVLVDLADLGYPPGDDTLNPIREQVYETWLAPPFHELFPAETRAQAYQKDGLPVMKGRVRAHASQQGNALFATLRLGLADDRAHDLVRLLLAWQWPDGGWNCHKKPEAAVSSFHETITPLRGLVAYVNWEGADGELKTAADTAVERAAEVFLTRRLFRRRRTGAVMDRRFLQPAYPRYWHYDWLFGLVVLKEAGRLDDPRCEEALAELERQRRPDGGWAALGKYYRVLNSAGDQVRGNSSRVDWGPTGKTRSNPWVTLDALEVLAAAGRPQ